MPTGRRAERAGGWAFSVLALAAAGVLFWAPWHKAGSYLVGSPDAGSGDPAVTAPANPAAAAIVPARLEIPAIGVDTTVESRGTTHYRNPFTGQTVEGYGVPESMLTTSWWSDGPRPGSGRMAVILGHEQPGGPGVFNRLDQLRPGDAVVLRNSDGTALNLRVLGSPVTGLDKATSALADLLNHHPAGADVALITCGGQFDDAARASEDNEVVFAGLGAAR